MILAFSDAIADDKRAAGWRRAFAEQSQTTFADEFADQIVLEASTLAKPVQGKERVATVLATASSIYESLEFTAEAHSGATTYLQWRATAFGGMEIKASPCWNETPEARSLQPRSTTGRWMSCCGSRPRFAIGSPA